MAAVTMHNLCVCRARQVLSSWLTRALPSFSSKTLTSALDPHSCGMHLVDSNTSRDCVANATMCRSFANVCIGYGFPPPKKSAHRVGVLIFLVEATRIELVSENESKRLSPSAVTNLSYRLGLLPVTESTLHYSVNFPIGDTDLSPRVANFLTLFQPRRRQADDPART